MVFLFDLTKSIYKNISLEGFVLKQFLQFDIMELDGFQALIIAYMLCAALSFRNP